jgi:predicted GNAT family acetyltransferase
MSEVSDNAARHRYELVADGQTAFAEYRIDGDTITFTHTIVPTALEGRGIGSRLVMAALDDARARGRSVIAQCSFVAGYIDRHPEYRDLMA